MNILIEFLDKEPIENVITCMNFVFDKVVFIGYSKKIEKYKKRTEDFLKEYCKVGKVEFVPVTKKNLDRVVEAIREIIVREKNGGHNVYFDITGGESLTLVAIGRLSEELNTPIHMYNIENNKLMEMTHIKGCSIRENVPTQTVKLNLDAYVKMYGAVINYNLHKDFKDNANPAFQVMVEKIWRVASEHSLYWNMFSSFMKKIFVPNQSLCVTVSTAKVTKELGESKNALDTRAELDPMLYDLKDIGAIENLVIDSANYSFTYCNESVMNILWDGGTVLELHTYYAYKDITDDCRVGVHIDWDGVIRPSDNLDVYNEIDVLTLNGYIPTFISCKSGKMNSDFALHALYELDTVAERFGGKYSKRILSVLQQVGDVYIERAEEMEIEIINS